MSVVEQKPMNMTRTYITLAVVRRADRGRNGIQPGVVQSVEFQLRNGQQQSQYGTDGRPEGGNGRSAHRTTNNYWGFIRAMTGRTVPNGEVVPVDELL